ncbi:MAG: hypothetical protein A2X03_09910 [Bacteroidetes bacterium GWA2_40_15]|nr:MAG: hypothetical protein A2X03_09910 [Bacteroidetes bacterium GWA2_40_15]HBH84261.1 hypothetical protein [Bacteroidales bacterium]
MALIFIISGLFLFAFFPFYFRNKWSRNKSIALLPSYFIIIGIMILLGCAIAPVIINVNDIPIRSELRNFFIIIGLLLISFSKEKTENESLNWKRLLSFFVSFMSVSFVYQVFMIFDFLNVRELSGSQVPILILVTYLFVFHFNKKTSDKM